MEKNNHFGFRSELCLPSGGEDKPSSTNSPKSEDNCRELQGSGGSTDPFSKESGVHIGCNETKVDPDNVIKIRDTSKILDADFKELTNATFSSDRRATTDINKEFSSDRRATTDVNKEFSSDQRGVSEISTSLSSDLHTPTETLQPFSTYLHSPTEKLEAFSTESTG